MATKNLNYLLGGVGDSSDWQISGSISMDPGKEIGFSFLSAVSAGGSTYADASLIETAFALVSPVGSGAGVRWSARKPGSLLGVYNAGANALKVYPPTGGTIGTGAANAAVTVQTQSALMAVAFAADTIKLLSHD